MKLISLNTWGGKMRKELLAFFSEHAPSTNIFCFQEVPNTPRDQRKKANIELGDTWFEDLQYALPNFVGYHVVTHGGFNWRPVDFDLSFGNAIFVQKGTNVIEDGHVFVHREKGAIHLPELLQSNWYTLPRVVQYIRVANAADTEITICNFHGLWHESGKGDIPERFEQSQKILQFMNKLDGRKILCGDFNLDIDSKSLGMLEQRMRNLIKEYEIETTRSNLYPKKDKKPFADYTLVSPDIEVQSFSVPQIEISDHLPMILEFK